MSREDISIPTEDGACRAFAFTPSQGSGPWPAVILYMDALAIRPALLAMAQRMADGGYLVLLPDLFYRIGDYPPFDPKAVFASGNIREVLKDFFASTDNRRAGGPDTDAFLAWIDGRGDGHFKTAPRGAIGSGRYQDRCADPVTAATYPSKRSRLSVSSSRISRARAREMGRCSSSAASSRRLTISQAAGIERSMRRRR